MEFVFVFTMYECTNVPSVCCLDCFTAIQMLSDHEWVSKCTHRTNFWTCHSLDIRASCKCSWETWWRHGHHCFHPVQPVIRWKRQCLPLYLCHYEVSSDAGWILSRRKGVHQRKCTHVHKDADGKRNGLSWHSHFQRPLFNGHNLHSLTLTQKSHFAFTLFFPPWVTRS